MMVMNKAIVLPPDIKNPLQQELMEQSLAYFVKKSWRHVGESGRYIHNWHIEAISEHLEAVSAGQIKRLVVNIPPRFMKSLITSTNWTAWDWIKHPERRWLTASHSLSLAIRDNRKCRNLIESAWYQERWGDVYGFSKDQNAKIRFENTLGGYRLAISVNSGFTGEGGDFIIIDDPHNARDINQKKRENTLDWYDGALSTRLNDPVTGSVVLIMQRLHENDLAGHVLGHGGWDHLSLPAEYEGSKTFTSIGFQDPRKKEGELLWPKRVSKENIAEIKHVMGSFKYASQFQQRPVPASGGQFKKSYFKYFKISQDNGQTIYRLGDRKIWHADKCSIFMTVDLAITENQESDYTVIGIWAQTPDREILLLDVIRERLDNPAQVKEIVKQAKRYNPNFIAIESVAYQLALVQQVRREGLPVKEYNPRGKGDKVARAGTASVLYEGGSIYHLHGASWLTDFETELLHFPKGEHDDQVDVVSMAAFYVAMPMEPRIRKIIG